MNRRGPVAVALTTLDAHSLRVTGGLGAITAAGIAVASVVARHGLDVTDESSVVAAITALDVTALLPFVVAHPAYPVAVLVGPLLLVLGDDAPLLGN